MSLPCYKRFPPVSPVCASDMEFAWDLPEEGVGIIRGPKAKEYLEDRGIKADLDARTSLERVKSRSPLRLYHADLELPGKLLGPDEDMPPQRRYSLMGTDEEKLAFEAEKRFKIAALAVETEADRVLAKAYLEMTGKAIPLLESDSLKLSEQIARARQATLALLSRDLTKDAYIPRFRSQEIPAEGATGYFGAPLMPKAMEWPFWRSVGESRPYLFHSQYRTADLPAAVKAYLPSDVEAFLVFVNPIIEDWPRLPDNPPFVVRFIRKGEACAVQSMPRCEETPPPARVVTDFCQTRDTGVLSEYNDRPDADPALFEQVAAVSSFGSEPLMEDEEAREFLFGSQENQAPQDRPLLVWTGDKFLGEPYWLQGAEYQSDLDGNPMTAFLHIAYDGVPELALPEGDLMRYGAGIIWLPTRWATEHSYESQIKMTWDMG
ncbi:hypothetical protein HW509_13600 [Asaia spathodeae]|uniref:hypothetical protein n=1 Tax=Asaia spathodeae TaxID=657016 RepID=UPI002FC34AF4